MRISNSASVNMQQNDMHVKDMGPEESKDIEVQERLGAQRDAKCD